MGTRHGLDCPCPPWSCSFTSSPYIVKVKLKKKQKKAKKAYTLTENKTFHSWKGVLEQGKTPVTSRLLPDLSWL